MSSAPTSGRGRKVAPASCPYSVGTNDSTWPRSTLRSIISRRISASAAAVASGSAPITSSWGCDGIDRGFAERCTIASG